MFLKKSLIAILFLVSFIKANAQKFELGKVSIEELQEKFHPIDTSAVAAILFNKGKVRFEYMQTEGFVMFTEVKTRIKIYKKEGYDWANKAVEYYTGSNADDLLFFSDVVTYNLEEGKIVKTKLKSDGEFEEKANKYWSRKKITLPNIKVGSVIEFKYIIRSKRFSELTEWAFQTNIPVNYSEFKTLIPEYYVYKPNQKGFIFPKVTVNKNTNSSIINSKERTPTATTFSSKKFEYEETETTYLAENLPAMKEEAFVNNIDNYTSSVSHELSMIKPPNEIFKIYSTDWATVTKNIYEYDDFGPELNKTGYFEDQINVLIKESKTQNEIMAAIFHFVKSNVKWNRYYGYSCNDGVKKAYHDKTGNVAEINLMLTAMLRFAGINANPVLLSTRENGVALFPSRTAFDYVIAAVETQDGLILLDATEKYALPNMLPIRDLNWFGRLIRMDGTSAEVDLMPKTVSSESANISFLISADGIINGKIRKQFSEYEALKFRNKYITINTESYLEKLENENNAIEISDYIRENETDLSKSIIESYAFKDSKSVEIINGKIYISPLLFMTTNENPFKQETREYPIDYGYPTLEKYNVSFEIPEGYTIETIPASINIAMPDGIGSFKYVIAQTENKIQLVVSTTINTAIVPADYYDDLKAFYQQMIDKQNEKIVLKKI